MHDIRQKETPLAQNFMLKFLLHFAFPTMLMMLFMGFYTFVDTVFVARFVDTNALSALNIVCPVINLLVGVGTMLATGGSAIVARKMGAGESVRALQMGIKGAALGTGIGYLIPTIAGVWFFGQQKGSLYFRKPVLDGSVLMKSCTNGFSEMVSQAATAVTTFLFNGTMLALLGEDGVAAITILIYTQF